MTSGPRRDGLPVGAAERVGSSGAVVGVVGRGCPHTVGQRPVPRGAVVRQQPADEGPRQQDGRRGAYPGA
ncbi:hypothetical protein ABZ078_00910 [Streptomyces sp. NPDC006385]|uniref:hypothetical protein n=1 Tax=Streptomyces sp. NPDC006385 TaxID=3156761 RepID=UPI00339FF9F5